MRKQIPFGTRYAKKARTPEQTREYRLQREYGITSEQYNQMSASQESKCAICGNTPDKRLVVDHCHVSGKVRALLCDPCNMGLGGLQRQSIRVRTGHCLCFEVCGIGLHGIIPSNLYD